MLFVDLCGSVGLLKWFFQASRVLGVVVVLCGPSVGFLKCCFHVCRLLLNFGFVDGEALCCVFFGPVVGCSSGSCWRSFAVCSCSLCFFLLLWVSSNHVCNGYFVIIMVFLH